MGQPLLLHVMMQHDVVLTVKNFNFLDKISFMRHTVNSVFLHCRSYADIGIHEQMISDEVRTQAYRLSILSYLLSTHTAVFSRLHT